MILEHQAGLSLFILGLILVLLCVILIRAFRKQTSEDIIHLQRQLDHLDSSLQGLLRALKEESAQNRTESAHQARLGRDEMGKGLRA